MPKTKYKKRKDGRYCSSIVVGKLENGNPKRKYAYGYTIEELERNITELKSLNYKGIVIDDNNITIVQWSKKWFEANISTKEFNTQRNILNILNNHIFPAIGDIKIKDLKQLHIQNMINDMLKEGLTDTAKRTLTTTKRILNSAIDNDIIFRNVANSIKLQNFKSKEKRPLSKMEDSLLLKVAKYHKYALFVLLLRYAGLRTEEAVALKIDNINLDSKYILIRNAVYFKNNQSYEKDTKNKKDRKIPILDIIFPLLQKEVECRKQSNIKYLFTKQTDIYCKLSKTAVRRIVESFVLACNKEYEKQEKVLDETFNLTKENKIHFTPHQLRHSYCTMLYYARSKNKKSTRIDGTFKCRYGL